MSSGSLHGSSVRFPLLDVETEAQRGNLSKVRARHQWAQDSEGGQSRPSAELGSLCPERSRRDAGQCVWRESLSSWSFALLDPGAGVPFSDSASTPGPPRSSQDLEWTLTAGACSHFSQCPHPIWSGGARAFEGKRQRKKRERVCRAKPPEPLVNCSATGFPGASDLDCRTTQEVLGRQMQVCDC